MSSEKSPYKEMGLNSHLVRPAKKKEPKAFAGLTQRELKRIRKEAPKPRRCGTSGCYEWAPGGELFCVSCWFKSNRRAYFERIRSEK